MLVAQAGVLAAIDEIMSLEGCEMFNNPVKLRRYLKVSAHELHVADPHSFDRCYCELRHDTLALLGWHLHLLVQCNDCTAVPIVHRDDNNRELSPGTTAAHICLGKPSLLGLARPSPALLVKHLVEPQVIRRPMDFGTIRRKLLGGVYGSVLDKVRNDVRLVAENAATFNGKVCKGPLLLLLLLLLFRR